MKSTIKSIFAVSFALLVYACGTSSSSKSEALSPPEFAEKLKSNNEIILLDVRSPEEIEAGFIEGAENLNYNDEAFSGSLDNLDHSKIYFVYCASGKRSGKASELMKEKGFTSVTTLEGGFNAWKANELPVKTK
ncbi:hypothetical protein BH09BAC3_BH09BAC3_16560 [soil metagenome]